MGIESLQSIQCEIISRVGYMSLIRQFSQVNATMFSTLLVPDHIMLEPEKGEALLECSHHPSYRPYRGPRCLANKATNGASVQKLPDVTPQQDQPRRSISQELDKKSKLRGVNKHRRLGTITFSMCFALLKI